MKGDVFADWMTCLNNEFKKEDRKVLMIMDNSSTHSLENVTITKVHGFNCLALSNMSIVFLPPNVTSVVQPLDQGIIASFKVQYRSKLVEWVLSEFDVEGGSNDLYKVVPNAKQAFLWCYQVWEEMEAQIIWNCWRAVRILSPHWNANLAMENEREKVRMVKESEELAALIAQLKLGDAELPLQDFVDIAGEECIEAEYGTNDLVNLAFENGLTMAHDFNFNTEVVNVDDQPPPVVRLSATQHHAQVLSHFSMDNSQDFNVHDVMEFEKILGRLRKMTIANRGRHHQRTLETYFVHN